MHLGQLRHTRGSRYTAEGVVGLSTHGRSLIASNSSKGFAASNGSRPRNMQYKVTPVNWSSEINI